MKKNLVLPEEEARSSFLVIDDRVELGSIEGGDIPDIGGLLQPSFDLERCHPGVDQVCKIARQVKILQVEQMLVSCEDIAAVVCQCVGEAAQRGTFSSVCTPAGNCLAKIALAAETHKEGTVDEELEIEICSRSDLLQLLQ